MGAPLGNKNAVKVKPWADALSRVNIQSEGAKLRALAEKVWDMALNGDLQAIREIADRTDGKAMSILDVTYREAESVSDQQARMMAEAYIESARRPGIRSEAADSVCDSEPS